MARDLRFAVDTGGTFTDLAIAFPDGGLRLYKSASTPADPVAAVLAAFETAAADLGMAGRALLERGSLLIHGTTRSINAVVTGATARTAFLTTSGHPDILLFREGGRPDPFDFVTQFPAPYVPRRLTFEVPERIGADGAVLAELDEDAVAQIIAGFGAREVEAVGVSLLWSVVNPVHERRVGALLDALRPDLSYTLSHQLNPILREYRRASASCIDASLKPLMTDYLGGLDQRLRAAGYTGELVVGTSQGGVMPAAEIADAPIHTLNSGPAMAPIAGRHYAAADNEPNDLVVVDCGGTTFDVSLIRDGRIGRTAESWLGPPYLGHMTGFPSVAVTSIGAGGGSIARVDSGGLLHVGPTSAGAEPGPACYGQGGREPTLTDAAVVLGYLDPETFLGGARRLDAGLARDAIDRAVAGPLALAVEAAAAAVLTLATETMVRAIEGITVNQGVDPRGAVLVAGGGAAGFNAVAIGRRLGSAAVIFPDSGAALSAVGGLLSDLVREFREIHVTDSIDFDCAGANAVLARLEARTAAFRASDGLAAAPANLTRFAEVRYLKQIWEVDVPLPSDRFDSPADIAALGQAMHREHQALFGYADPDAVVEVVAWRVRVERRLPARAVGAVVAGSPPPGRATHRTAYFPEVGASEVPVYRLDSLANDRAIAGPAIVETPFTSIVLLPETAARRTTAGALVVDL